MPVSVERMAGFPKFSGSRDELSVTQQFKIAWSDINNLYVELFPAAVGSKPSLPAFFAGSTVLYADSIEIEPFIGEDDIPECPTTNQEYDYARATITYKTIPYEQGGGASDQIITRKWTTSGDFLVLPSHALYWSAVGDANKILDPDVRAGKVLPMMDITVTLHRVTEAYFETLRDKVFELVGNVNDALFEGASQETLLLLGGDFTQTVSADGTKTYQCEIKFQYKRVLDALGAVAGWNHFYNPKTGHWERVVDKNSDNVYTPSDFTQLYS